MLLRRLIDGAGLDPFALPVQIVELDLDELHFRVLRQDPVQQLRRVVEGKAYMPHQALTPLLQKPVEAVILFIDRVAVGLDAMQQIIVEILRAGQLQLLLKDAVAVLKGVDKVAVELGGQRETIPGPAVHQRGLDRPLGLKAVIRDGRVEIGEASFQEKVHHSLELFQIDALFIVGVQQGKPHQAEAKIFHGSFSSDVF